MDTKIHISLDLRRALWREARATCDMRRSPAYIGGHGQEFVLPWIDPATQQYGHAFFSVGQRTDGSYFPHALRLELKGKGC